MFLESVSFYVHVVVPQLSEKPREPASRSTLPSCAHIVALTVCLVVVTTVLSSRMYHCIRKRLHLSLLASFARGTVVVAVFLALLPPTSYHVSTVDQLSTVVRYSVLF